MMQSIWEYELKHKQIEAKTQILENALEMVLKEHMARVSEFEKAVLVTKRFESLKTQLSQRELDLARNAVRAEQEAQAEQGGTSDLLREKMKELQKRINSIPERREAIESRLISTRDELIALHNDILKDQPGIEEGIKRMDAFSGKDKSKSEKSAVDNEDKEKGKGGEEDGKESGESTLVKEAKNLGLSVEELESFQLANEEYESMANELHEKEVATKESLLEASKESELVQTDLAARAAAMETVTSSVSTLATEVKNVEALVAKTESRHENLTAKSNELELRAALDESKTLDRLIEALSAKVGGMAKHSPVEEV